MKGEELADDLRAVVNLRVDLKIDETYVPDMNQRLMIYRKVAEARNDEDIDQVLEELRDRYGPLPEAVEHLEQYGRIRVLADRLGVESIDREAQTVLIKFRPDTQGKRLNVERLIKVVGARADAILLPPAAIKLDLKVPLAGRAAKAGLKASTTTPVVPTFRSAGSAKPPHVGTKTQSLRQGQGSSWWTARATTGEVTAGFSKEEILRPPKEDPNAPDGVFARVRGLLQDLGIQ